MTDRKTFWCIGLLCAAMFAAAFWRFSLLPDWHQLPVVTPAGPKTRNGLVLFLFPLGILLVMGVAFLQNWLMSGPREALAARRRWMRPMLVLNCTLMPLMQALVTARSLGHGLSLNPEAFSRLAMFACGAMVMVQGNFMPKLPRLSTRFALFELDPWQSARALRFSGRMTVAFGLAMIVAAVLMPLRATLPTFLCLLLVFYAVVIWHFVRLKRERSSLA